MLAPTYTCICACVHTENLYLFVHILKYTVVFLDVYVPAFTYACNFAPENVSVDPEKFLFSPFFPMEEEVLRVKSSGMSYICKMCEHNTLTVLQPYVNILVLKLDIIYN